MAKRNTRKNGENVAAPMMGGKKSKKSSKKTRKQTPWMKKVMETYREMKKKNPATRLGDAMKEAKKRS
jgi:hypothetical protein